MMAAARMGLAVKTDGAAIAIGKAVAGLYLPDDKDARQRTALTTTTVKLCIDIFVGVRVGWSCDAQAIGAVLGLV